MTGNLEWMHIMDKNKEIQTIVSNVIKMESEEVLEQIDQLDYTVVSEIIDVFCNCKGKIMVTGCGTSGAAAKKIAHTLCCIDRPAMYLNPADAFHGGLGIVSKEDVVVILSKGGATPELVQLAKICEERHAKTIAVSERNHTDLTDICDIWLKVKVEQEPDEFDMLATASTLAVISVLDAIAICVMQKTHFSKSEFAMIHPGGAVGERLMKR